MAKNEHGSPINLPTIMALGKAAILGFLTAEVVYLILAITKKLPIYQAVILGLSFVLITVLYVLARNGWGGLRKILYSRRIDILGALVFGMLFSKTFNGLLSKFYTPYVEPLTSAQALILLATPLIVPCFALMRQRWISRNEDSAGKDTFFISDKEEEETTEDLLGIAEKAKIFAEQVLNRNSADSMVFGIDAPWGIGKSTFVNFCKEYWTNTSPNKPIIYSFQPLRYEADAGLLEKFVDGMIRAIQREEFIPEIRPLFSRYSKMIQSGQSLLNKLFGLDIPSFSYSVDEAFEDIEDVLKRLPRKVIVTVDDLDRLDFATVKDILFSIKKSFTLPNVTFVLCYDTENFSALEKSENFDRDKLAEFLEKFVNVKISLFLDDKLLWDYILNGKNKALKNNTTSDVINITETLGALKGIYDSDSFDDYRPFIGDLRKVKRLINVLIMLDVDKTNFTNTDIDRNDLLHLLLIYINYPDIFRKIYNTETGKKRGFFSALYPHDAGYPKEAGKTNIGGERYKNSISYSKYTEGLNPNQRLLVDAVFDVSERYKGQSIDSIEENEKRTRACFNGGWTHGRNLEEYLKLIVQGKKPEPIGQYHFYLDCLNTILAGGTIADVFAKPEFAIESGEKPHEHFWRAVINNVDEIGEVKSHELIKAILARFPHHSYYTDEESGFGLRDNLVYFLVKLLDTIGWRDPNGKHSHNFEPYINEIAEWVFGEGRHADSGVIKILGEKSRGILGLNDLLTFRLVCSADRSGGYFNLSRAIGKHGDVNAPSEGSTKEIAKVELREVSQKVFGMFQRDYIEHRKNIFVLAEELTLEDFGGDYHHVIEKMISEGKIEDHESRLASLKNQIIAFTVYQLTTDRIEHGVGCGYYDPTGKADQKVIRNLMNNYLFDICFDPSIEACRMYFMDYLILNFARSYSVDRSEDKYQPNEKEFTKALNKENLIEYWRANAQTIRATVQSHLTKKVIIGERKATYEKEGLALIEFLDGLVTPTQQDDDSIPE